MKNRNVLVSLAALLALAVAAPSAHADNNWKKKHPRRAEVLKRDSNQMKKNAQAEHQGKITQRQENKLNAEDAQIRAQEQADAKANGGYITKSEQQGLNREENRVNAQRRAMERNDKTGDATKFAKEHPRRAEVLGRANNEEGKTDAAEATGKITAQQANQLNREDQAIKRQEQRDARKNGGYITKDQQQQLNKEENAVNQQRAKDEAKDANASNQ
jgi:hypothetical protein